MELLIERGPAAAALARAMGIVERRQIIPILGNVALSTEGQSVILRATDLEGEVLEVVPAVVSGEGAITVPADKLNDIVRNADTGAQIKIVTVDGDPRAKVRFGRSNFALPTLDAKGFPKFPSDGLGEPFSMPAADLAAMIDRVMWSTDATDKNTIKGTVFLGTKEVDGERQLHAMGACSTGFALCAIPAPEGAAINAVLPIKVASHIRGWLKGAEGDCQVSCAYHQGEDKPGRLICVTHGGATFKAKLFDVPAYFDYGSRLLREHDLYARPARDELERAIRRVMIMSDGRTGTLFLTFSEGQMTVRATGADLASGEGVEEIGAEYEGPEVQVMIKGSQLVSALGALTGDIVEFGFSGRSEETDERSVLVIIRAPCDPTFLSNVAQMRA